MTSLIQPLEVGDLVEFYASGSTAYAVASYPPIGVIIHVQSGFSTNPQNASMDRYTVVWGDGVKTTTEWRCYLRKLS